MFLQGRQQVSKWDWIPLRESKNLKVLCTNMWPQHEPSVFPQMGGRQVLPIYLAPLYIITMNSEAQENNPMEKSSLEAKEWYQDWHLTG